MRKLFIATLVGLLFAQTASAQWLEIKPEEVELTFTGIAEWDNNVFNTSEDAPGRARDFLFRVGPKIRLRRTQGDLSYDVQYETLWESFANQTAPSVFDHYAFGRAAWQVGPRTTLFATDRFALTRSLNRGGFLVDPAAPDAVATTEIEVARQRIKRNIATLGVTHAFTPRLEGSGSLDYLIFQRSAANSFDNTTLSGTGQLLYALSENDRVGGGMGVTWQTFDGTATQNGSNTFFYRWFATWIHVFDPTMTLSVSGGPTLIDSDTRGSRPTTGLAQQFPFRNTETGGVRFIDSNTCPTNDSDTPVEAETCDVFPTEFQGQAAQIVRSAPLRQIDLVDDGDDFGSTVTFFGSIEFVKNWETWRTILGYRRTDSSASGLGQSTVLDAITGQLIWEPDRNWDLRFVTQFTSRTSATNQTANAIGLGDPVTNFTLLAAGGVPVTVFGTASPSTSLVLASSDQFTDVRDVRVFLNVQRKIGRDFEFFGRLTYIYQDGDIGGRSRTFDKFGAFFGFRYRFAMDV